MRARVERDVMRPVVKIWLWDEHPRGVRVMRLVGHDTWQDEIVPPDVVQVEPSLQLPEQGLEALLRAASGVVPASDATTAHLKDAVAVRDRLLTLVETRGARR